MFLNNIFTELLFADLVPVMVSAYTAVAILLMSCSHLIKWTRWKSGLLNLVKKVGKSTERVVQNGLTLLNEYRSLQLWKLLLVLGMISYGASLGWKSYQNMKEKTTEIIKIQSETISLQSKQIDSLTYKINTILFQSELDPYIYYLPEEFDSPDLRGSNEKMDSTLLQKIALLNIYVEEELNINSAYRTSARNRRAGGVHNSAHKTGHAVDIRVLNTSARYKVLKKAIELGIPRIGIHNRFIHLDIDTTKVHPVIWLY
jgi:uncharacterized protein YcbK (DUF882 family)